MMLCRVSDDSIVVIKFRPVKAGNSVPGRSLCDLLGNATHGGQNRNDIALLLQ